jgi:hypothetical protein
VTPTEDAIALTTATMIAVTTGAPAAATVQETARGRATEVR